MPETNPKFSGSIHENVNLYIKECRFMWGPHNCAYTELSEARAMSLYQGTSGLARSFLDGLDEAVLDDFDQSSTQLKKNFPWYPRPETRNDIIMRRILDLKQGEMSFDDYAEHGLKLEAHIISTSKEFAEPKDVWEQRFALNKQWLFGLKGHFSDRDSIIEMLEGVNSNRLGLDGTIGQARFECE